MSDNKNDKNIEALNKVILPVIRRVMPSIIAHEIVGVQPMTGPRLFSPNSIKRIVEIYE